MYQNFEINCIIRTEDISFFLEIWLLIVTITINFITILQPINFIAILQSTLLQSLCFIFCSFLVKNVQKHAKEAEYKPSQAATQFKISYQMKIEASEPK